MDNPLIEAGIAESFYTIPFILAHYARLLVFPVSLSVDYGFTQIPVQTTPVPLAILTALLGMAVYAFRSAVRESRSMVLGLAVLLTPILAVANPFVVSGSMLSERYLCTPAVGFVLLIGALVHRFRPASIPDSFRRR